jgi:hypothetical protein
VVWAKRAKSREVLFSECGPIGKFNHLRCQKRERGKVPLARTDGTRQNVQRWDTFGVTPSRRGGADYAIGIDVGAINPLHALLGAKAA